MPYGIFADIVVLIHLAFVIFAVLGAFLIIWRPWILWLHLPAIFWAIWIEMTGGICPLTPLENWLRIRAGQGGYLSRRRRPSAGGRARRKAAKKIGQKTDCRVI